MQSWWILVLLPIANAANVMCPGQFPNQPCGSTLFTDIVVFGDSWTCNGYGYLNESQPPFDNRAVNGRTWVEYLAPALGANLYDYAKSGATANNSVVTRTTPDISQQQAEFFNNKSIPTLDPSTTLYSIWVGVNDLHDMFLILNLSSSDQNLTRQNVLNSVQNELTSLYNYGSRQFFLPNVIDLSTLPLASNETNAVRSAFSDFVKEYDTMYASMIASFSSSYPDVNVHTFDSWAFFKGLESNPTAYQYAETILPCLDHGVICNDPSSYLWWDNWHPTTYTSSLLAKAMEPQLTLASLSQQSSSSTSNGASTASQTTSQTGSISNLPLSNSHSGASQLGFSLVIVVSTMILQTTILMIA